MNPYGVRGCPLSEEDNFWVKVEKGAPDECWPWKAGLTRGGYGTYGRTRRLARERGIGRHIRAHRAAWLYTYGEIPAGLFVLHHCDNRLCVNPKHLFLGTHTDNMRDCCAKGRHSPGPIADLVPRIRELHRRGERNAEIARQLQVPSYTVSRVVLGQIYRERDAA